MNKDILVDTSGLYALVDSKSSDHEQVVKVVTQATQWLILPIPVLPELCYLLHSRLGYFVMRRFLERLTIGQPRLATLDANSLERVVELMEQYHDMQLDFTDAAIIAIAERLNVTRVLTLDRRDFLVVRPKHCTVFELLP